MIPIPSDFRWKTDHTGGIFGILQETQNANMDEEGYFQPSPKAVSLYSKTIHDDFGIPLKILYYNQKYFVLTNNEVFEFSGGLTPTRISLNSGADAPDPGDGSDAVVWQNQVYVSSNTTTDIRRWNGSIWTDPSIAITTTDTPHPMAVFSIQGPDGALVFGDKNLVKVVNTSHTVIATLTLSVKYAVTSLVVRQNYIYIGTKAIDGGEAKMFVWKGSGSEHQNEYGVGCDGIFAMTEYNSSVSLVTSNGELLRFNGAGFDRLAVFPVYNSPYRWSKNTGSAVIGKVHLNGMVADGDVLYINVNGSVGKSYLKGATTHPDSFYLFKQPSGVWCYDPAVGLYHRNGPTNRAYTTYTASSLSSNTLTLSATTLATTGEPIHCKAKGSLTGIDNAVTYYLIRVANNQVKLALTRADALSGTAITLGGSVTSAQFFIIDYRQKNELYTTNTDVGCIARVQADESNPLIFPEIFQSLYLWGFVDSSDIPHLCSESLGSNTAIAKTARVFSQTIKDAWQKIFVRTDGIDLDADALAVSVKTKDRISLPAGIMEGTYSSSTVIGSSSALLDRAIVGDTVVIVSGNGGGERRQITAITGDELTLSEEIPGAAGADAITFYIEPFERMQLASTSSRSIGDGYAEVPLDRKTSQWIEILLELRGKIKVPQMLLDNVPAK
jgi:hypothetical protein